MFVEFFRQKDELRNPEELQVKERNYYLSEFILSGKRKDGEEYEPSNIVHTANIVKDLVFEKTRKVFKVEVNNSREKEKVTSQMQRRP